MGDAARASARIGEHVRGILTAVDRSTLLAHIRTTHFASGDRERACSDARSIAAYLRDTFGARVWGIGSAFDHSRRFGTESDIDLVVDGLPDRRFFHAYSRAASMTAFPLDLLPLQSASEAIAELVRREGVEL